MKAITRKATNLPFIISDSETANSPSCFCTVLTSASALNVGDAVFVDSSGKVDKSTSVGSYLSRIGIVIGGEATNMYITDDVNLVGSPATTGADQRVIVAYSGVYWAIADGVIGTSSPVGIGAAITTAGRLASSPADGKVFGIALVGAAAAGDRFQILIALS